MKQAVFCVISCSIEMWQNSTTYVITSTCTWKTGLFPSAFIASAAKGFVTDKVVWSFVISLVFREESH